MLKKPLTVVMLDALMLNLCFIAVFSIRFYDGVPQRNLDAYLNSTIFITIIFIIICYIQGLYDFDESDDGVSIFFKVFTSVGLGMVGVMAATFFLREFAFPRTVILFSYMLLLLLFTLYRIYIHQRFLKSLPARRAVIYGHPERFDHLENHMYTVTRRYLPVAKVREENEDELHGILDRKEADCVFITDGVANAQDRAFRLFLEYPDVILLLMPKLSHIVTGAKHHIVMGDVPLIALSHKTIIGRLFLLKRIMDLTISFAALILFSPFILAIAAGVKVTSRGPVFYTQPRVGRNGRVFNVIKFRTMVQDAEKKTGPMFSSEDDPRVTPIGRFLRRYKLDELPQFINVIKGEMSIVGPRPERPVFVDEFEKDYPGYSERKKVLPGITGFAQVNGDYESDPSIKLMYDLLYIYNYTPIRDLAIMYQTVHFILKFDI